MEYTDQVAGTVELPKLTLDLARKMNAHRSAREPEEAWRAEYEFLRAALPPAFLAEALDGEAFDAIDLSALDVVFAGVARAYTKPAVEAQAQAASDQLSGFDGELMDKAMRLVGAVERMQQMQQPRKGFRAAR